MARILVFDSGVGGLSVLDEIKGAVPPSSFIYVADNGFYPYGSKSESALVSRVTQVLSAAVEGTQPDIVVVACNSASTVALPALRAEIKVATVGTVPAIKPACQASRSRVIGLLGTPGTVKRAYTDDLIEAHGEGCQVIRFGATDLVDLAERKLAGERVTSGQVAGAVRGLFKQTGSNLIDHVVLACTHFPLLAEELRAVSRSEIVWVDSGKAIARRVASLLEAGGVASDNGVGSNIALFTRAHESAEALRPALVARGFDEVSYLEL